MRLAALTQGATGSGSLGVVSTTAGAAAALAWVAGAVLAVDVSAVGDAGVPSPPPMAERRALLLARRCSGISVNAASAASGMSTPEEWEITATIRMKEHHQPSRSDPGLSRCPRGRPTRDPSQVT